MSEIKLLEIQNLHIFLEDLHQKSLDQSALVKDDCYWLRLTVKSNRQELIYKRERDATLFMTTFCYDPNTDQFFDRNGRVLFDLVYQDSAMNLGIIEFFKCFPRVIEQEIRTYLNKNIRFKLKS